MNPAGIRDPLRDGPHGDAIPFFFKGRYHLYYLEAPAGVQDQPDRGRTPWRHLVSDDLVHWDDLGIALPLGAGSDPDVDGIWTGSVIERDGLIHIFYTGGRRRADTTTPQTVCHATSVDGVIFVKDEVRPMMRPPAWFEQRDWRDPFVFWNADRGEYWMLVTSRASEGPSGRRGIIALSTSPDLTVWTTRKKPFYAPGITYSMECPELFELGGRWRLAFSRFTEEAATVYREADSPEGPWRTPAHPAFDGPRWYAAKSLTDDRGRRISFGWVHDRRDQSVTSEWLWGGDMCLPREIYVGSADRLCVRPPEEIDGWLNRSAEIPVLDAGGKEHASLAAMGSFAFAELAMPVVGPELHRLTVTAELRDLRGGVGLVLFGDETMTGGLRLFVDAASGMVSLGDIVSGNEPDRMPPPLVTNWVPPRATGQLRFDIYRRGDVLEIFVDRQAALTHRNYDTGPMRSFFFVEDGAAAVTASLASLSTSSA